MTHQKVLNDLQSRLPKNRWERSKYLNTHMTNIGSILDISGVYPLHNLEFIDESLPDVTVNDIPYVWLQVGADLWLSVTAIGNELGENIEFRTSGE